MKVTVVTRDYAKVSGGHNTWLPRFLPSLRQRGIDSRVLCFCTSGEEFPTIRTLRRLGFECTSICETGKYTKGRVRWIFDRLAEDPPDIFMINAVYPAAYYVGRWLRESGIPTVGVCHGGGMMWFYPGLLDQFVCGDEAYRLSALVCVSNWLLEDVRLRSPKRILLESIPCGVPIPEKMASWPNGRLKVAYVGRLIEEQKCISEVTRGLCRVVREIPGTEAVIYGDGPARGAVENIIREHGGGDVQLAGFVESSQVQRLLSECHAIVLLSDHEGLGLSLLEGMACGVVPIAFRGAPGVTEFVVDGVTGLLVRDRGDDFVAAVRRLKENPRLWDRLARSARSKAEAEYSEKVCADRWQELFHKLVNNNGPRKPFRIPRRIHLPAVHPRLTSLDPRLPQELIQRARSVVSRLKHHYLPMFELR
jgi:glycosyltransferase involved in cell wall biosynthesis